MENVNLKMENNQAPGPTWSYILIPLVVLLVLGVGYGVLAKSYEWWPHEVTISPTPSTSDVDMTLISGPTYTIEGENQENAISLFVDHSQDLDTVDTTGWQTYRNEEDGFEVKYPPEWELAGKNVLAAISNAPDCNCIFFESTTDSTRIDIFEDRVGNEEKAVIANLEWTLSPYSEMKIAGDNAQAGDPSQSYLRVPIRTLYRRQRDHAFVIHLQSEGVKHTEYKDPIDPKEVPIFWKILSTFKFTN